MSEFWETSFIEKQTMWGFEPAESAILANEVFVNNNVKDILLPGIGYGRNAKIFLNSGIQVTGIEISQTAIDLARTENKLDIPIYHSSVTDMPFDNKLYDGIFSYALIHLLNRQERKKFISDCYSQLKPGGYMIFSTISKDSPSYGKGKQVSKDRFEAAKGANVYFYNADSIQKEFGQYGLIEYTPVDEPIKFAKNHPPMKFTVIICRKEHPK